MNTQTTRKRKGAVLGRFVIATALVGGLAFAAGAAIEKSDSPPTVPDSLVQSLKEQSRAFAEIERVTSPAVVSIRVEKTMSSQQPQMGQIPFGNGNSPFDDDLFERFFGGKAPEGFQFRQFRPQKNSRTQSEGPVAVGQGSGFIVTADGYIITNNHVIADADKVIVRLKDEREFEATIVGSDSHTDVAVLQIKASNLPTLQLGDSDALQVGEWVLASGAPFGLTHTLTAGIVSATGRSSVGIADYENFIQTDAAINPGNSGGPLLNLNGQVVGMNTAIFSKSGGYMGVGFSIPVNMVRQVYEQIIDHGSVTRAYLGVMIQKLTPELAASFNVKSNHGALIGAVRKDTPGAKAGLKEGDIVTAINGKKYDDVGRFRNAIALMSPGNTVDLTVLRDGKELHLKATLEELPDSAEPASTDSGTMNRWGFALQNLTPELAKQLNLSVKSGVVVTDVKRGSIAHRAGLQPGVLIEQLNRKPVHSVNEFKSVLENTADGDSLLLLITDGESSRFVALKAN